MTTTSGTTTSSSNAIPEIQGLGEYKFRDGTEITLQGAMPQKKYYRSRAHANPLSFNDNLTYPAHPDLMDWSPYYPALSEGTAPTVLDIGCGFGGLTIELSTLLPNAVVLGLEIRAKVCEYVRLRIMSLRNKFLEGGEEGEASHSYANCACLRSNTMKNLVNYIQPASLDKIFICFPDPHFKAKNHRRRIVSYDLLTEYAYLLKPNSILYLITDVKALHEWHLEKSESHEMFQRVEEGLDEDPCVKAMVNVTEEGKKVERSGSDKYYAIYRRIPDEEVVTKGAEEYFNS